MFRSLWVFQHWNKEINDECILRSINKWLLFRTEKTPDSVVFYLLSISSYRFSLFLVFVFELNSIPRVRTWGRSSLTAPHSPVSFTAFSFLYPFPQQMFINPFLVAGGINVSKTATSAFLDTAQWSQFSSEIRSSPSPSHPLEWGVWKLSTHLGLPASASGKPFLNCPPPTLLWPRWHFGTYHICAWPCQGFMPRFSCPVHTGLLPFLSGTKFFVASGLWYLLFPSWLALLHPSLAFLWLTFWFSA